MPDNCERVEMSEGLNLFIRIEPLLQHSKMNNIYRFFKLFIFPATSSSFSIGLI